jgi:hypothetical protein
MDKDGVCAGDQWIEKGAAHITIVPRITPTTLSFFMIFLPKGLG